MEPKRYKQSGKFSPIGIPLMLGLGGAAAVGLGFAYAYAILYIPIVGTLSFLLALGFGVLVGFAVGLSAQMGKVRNTLVAGVVATGLALLGFYVHWGVWAHGILSRGSVEVPLLNVLLNPGALFDLVVRINEVGAWSMKGMTPSGGVLWVMWGLEALLIVVPIVFLGLAGASNPFCEACGTWCDDKEGIGVVSAEDRPQAEMSVASQDYASLSRLRPAKVSDGIWCRVDVSHCPNASCGRTNTVSLFDVKLEVSDKGEVSLNATPILRHQLLEAEARMTLEQACQELQLISDAPADEAEATS